MILMTDRHHRWLALLVGLAIFAVGAATLADPGHSLGVLPKALMFIGAGVCMWMAAKLFWTDHPPQWFYFFITLGSLATLTWQ